MKLVERERIQTIPRGLWPPAQGCRVCEATLGHDRNGINRNAVVANVARRAETKWPQPRRGWKYWLDGDPGLRVPRNAGLWNVIPLGFSDGPKLRLVLIMPIPIALKAFVRIELPFQCQKLGEPGITALDLLTRSKLVIRQIITSFVTNRQINEPTKGFRGILDALFRVFSMHGENYTSIGLARPREDTFVISLD